MKTSKRPVKGDFPKIKKYTSGAGGGPNQPNLIITYIKIKEIIGTIQLEGLPSVCDSDCPGQSSLLASVEHPSANIGKAQFPPQIQSIQNSNVIPFSSVNLYKSVASESQAFVAGDDSNPTDQVTEDIPI